MVSPEVDLMEDEVYKLYIGSSHVGSYKTEERVKEVVEGILKALEGNKVLFRLPVE